MGRGVGGSGRGGGRTATGGLTQRQFDTLQSLARQGNFSLSVGATSRISQQFTGIGTTAITITGANNFAYTSSNFSRLRYVAQRLIEQN